MMVRTPPPGSPVRELTAQSQLFIDELSRFEHIVLDLLDAILVTYQPFEVLVSMNVTPFDFAEKQHRPGKVVALHLNYPSRIQQRGRNPKFPGYFLKATSSIATTG